MGRAVKLENLEKYLRRALIERKRALMAGRQAAEAAAQEILSERETDWEDEAARLSAARGQDRIGDNERAQLARVQAALEGLESGTWGWCVRCGQRIPEARLRAMPEALTCAACG